MGKGERDGPGAFEREWLQKNKNSTNEASMLLKANVAIGNEAKKYIETKELYENIGNEAKKWLKTKHITSLSGANYARFAHQLAQIWA
jgi:hypothetical protein